MKNICSYGMISKQFFLLNIKQSIISYYMISFHVLNIMSPSLRLILALQFLLQSLSFLFHDFKLFLAGILHFFMLILQQIIKVMFSILKFCFYSFSRHFLQFLLNLIVIIFSYLAFSYR